MYDSADTGSLPDPPSLPSLPSSRGAVILSERAGRARAKDLLKVDWRTSVNGRHPIYVIDKLQVYRPNPNVTDRKNWADSTLRATWN